MELRLSEEPNEFYQKKSDTEYRHFETARECELFIINNKHMKIKGICCGGKGCVIKRELKPIPKEIEKGTKGTKGTCDICFLEDKTLYKKCNTCNGTLCGACIEKLPTKKCPYCRSLLKLDS
jgi:hypothetical protein